MSRLRSAVSTVAVINLVFILALAGWLVATGRMDLARAHRLRAMLAEPVAVEAARLAQEAEAEDAAARAARAEARDLHPDPPSAVVNDRAWIAQASLSHAESRVRDIASRLRDDLDRAAVVLARDRAAFEAERTAWQKATEAERARRVDEQFRKAVRQYELLPSKLARDLLARLCRDGQTAQAVAYLDAMEARSAARILREFKAGDDPVLATELLERLRVFGLPPDDPESAPDDERWNRTAAAPADPRR